MLLCPECKSSSIVVDTRPLHSLPTPSTRRRRECIACHHRWTTYETQSNPEDYKKMKKSLAWLKLVLQRLTKDVDELEKTV